MKNAFKKILRKFGQVIALSSSLALFVFITAAIGVQIFAFWLNTEKGGVWLEGQISDLTEETPYHVTLENLSLNGFFGLGAERLIVSDEKGMFLELKNVDVEIDLLPIALKKVWLNFEAEQAIWLRNPIIPKKNDDSVREKAFIFPQNPDIYINGIALKVDIEELLLKEQETAIKVTARQSLDLNKDRFILQGDIETAFLTESPPVRIPSKITYELAAEWGGKTVMIDSFNIMRDAIYKAEGAAIYDPDKNHLDIEAEAVIDKRLDPRISEDIHLSANVSGGLEQYDGNIAAEGAFMGQPLTFGTKISGQAEKITLSDISGKAKGIDLNGGLVIGFSPTIWLDGEIKAAIENMELISALTGAKGLSGRGFARTAFHVNENGKQIFSGEGNFSNLSYKGTKLETLAWTAQPMAGGDRVDIGISLKGVSEKPFTGDATFYVDLAEKRLELASMIVTTKGGNIEADGKISMEDIALKASFTKLDLRQLPFIDFDLPVIARNGALTVSGSMAIPVIKADTSLVSALENNIKIDLSALYRNQEIQAQLKAQGKEIDNLKASVTIPAQISFRPFVFDINSSTPLSGQANGSFDLSGLPGAFLNPNHKLTGHVDLSADISGSLDAPLFNGKLALVNGAYENRIRGIDLTDIGAKAAFSGKKITITSLSAQDRQGGMLKGSGHIDFTNGIPPDVNLDIHAESMRLADGRAFQADVTADIAIVTREDVYTITGTLIPEELVYTLPARFDTAIPELNIVEEGQKSLTPFLESIKLDMVFDARERVIVRGWGLDVRMDGKLDIGGTVKAPDIQGILGVVRGSYEEFGRRFDLVESKLSFQGVVPPSPYLDIRAQTEIEDYTIQVFIRGTARDPRISFGSVPSMPEDEVLAYILFGKNVTQISPFQAIQLANTIRRFSGHGGGFDPVNVFQEATGLDDLRIEGGTGEGVTVGAGKYLSEDVYIELQQGGDDNSAGARIEVEITPQITIESQVGARGDTGGGIFWEWDY